MPVLYTENICKKALKCGEKMDQLGHWDPRNTKEQHSGEFPRLFVCLPHIFQTWN